MMTKSVQAVRSFSQADNPGSGYHADGKPHESGHATLHESLTSLFSSLTFNDSRPSPTQNTGREGIRFASPAYMAPACGFAQGFAGSHRPPLGGE